MNRIEMFLELKKDNTKVFKSELGNLYYINQCGDLVYTTNNSNSYEIIVTNINFNSDVEYTEVKRPFRERIKENDKYYYIEDSGEIESDIFTDCRFEWNRVRFGNVFETEQECREALIKVREVLRNE